MVLFGPFSLIKKGTNRIMPQKVAQNAPLIKLHRMDVSSSTFPNADAQKKSTKMPLNAHKTSLVHSILAMGKANKDRLFSKDSGEAYAGKGGLTQYFKQSKKRGRPKKKRGRPKKNNAKKGGRSSNKSPPDPPRHLQKSPPEQSAAAAAGEDVEDGVNPVEDAGGEEEEEEFEDDDVDDVAPKKKKCRINWGKEPHHSKLQKAIDDYLNKTGDALDNNDEWIEDINVYAALVGIPYNTLYKYVCPRAESRRVLGVGTRGRTQLISDDNVKFIGETFVRLDRSNDGASRKEGTDYVMSTVPNLTRPQASRQLSRVILPKCHEAGLLKKGVQKVQATTSDRVAISLPQQYRWHKAVDNAYKFLRETNIGICKKSGKSFGEVMSHFVIGLDEMCIMSDAHGSLHVIGAADKKKHEKLLQDSRCSITIVRTGTCAGTTGPTISIEAM